ncbi:ABC transporter substrate-binding protein [uncultured Chloroflexus sp.]|uniref:ABC transporter substrate-binding protein n=1 Tax=uncultured Chloroflexus sp. TaxID=214040 RepID=UPI0026328FAC|nr:ABC transporter substrate-binding protein [uncultured Chloroflexus sp.]
MASFTKRIVAVAMVMAMIVPMLAACGGTAQPQVIRETVVVLQTAEPVRETVRETVVVTEEVKAEQYTTPHPILSDVRVRQAIAYCTNRPELIQSVYPYLTPEQQQELLMDTFLPKAHWAAAKENITVYPFDPDKGKALLEEAGWTGSPIRTNANGEPLALSFTTTNAQFRQTWSAVFIRQMAACGIQVIPTYAPASWWFGSSTGLRRRDFELGAFAWVGQADPGGQTLYSCNQIPLASNNWNGQNYMGWCNERASRAIIAANNTLDRAERIRQYAIVQEEFTKDMVSLPLFNRLEAYAASKRLVNFKPNPTEYYTANADEWELSDGGDTIVLGFTQEPQTMWSLIESAAVQRVAVNLLGVPSTTSYDYDYQPVGLDGLSTIENGRATNVDVEVKEGDIVWTTDGEAKPLAPGIEITTADGETITYQGGTVKMKQLTVTDKWISGITWEDGEPLKKADFELAYKINCDPKSGATSLTFCESIAKVDFISDTEYTVTFHPGVQWPTYFTGSLGYYPSHQVLSDGRKLADVPAEEWQTLPEIIERPLSTGPYVLKEWAKGQSMTFEANPNYYKGEVKIKRVIIKFIADTNQAVAQLLTGEVDVLGSETLGAGAEVQTVIEAGNRGEIQAFVVPSPTWEHIDMNLFTK